MLNFSLCWPHSRQAHCSHGGGARERSPVLFAGPWACLAQPTSRELWQRWYVSSSLALWGSCFLHKQILWPRRWDGPGRSCTTLDGLSPLECRGQWASEGNGVSSGRASEIWAGHKIPDVQHRKWGCSKKCVKKERWARCSLTSHMAQSAWRGALQASEELVTALPAFLCVSSRTVATHISKIKTIL